MMSFFQIAPSDQSIYYLGSIFGLVGNLLPTDQPPMLLGIMFKVLNTTALTIGAMLVIYVIVVGLFKTAQEGEFLGKQWNSLWVPIRTVLGIAALFPTATGYSAIQIVFMWIIVQGIGAADTLWTTVVNYSIVVGSPYATVSIPTTQIQSNMTTLFQGLVCQASARAKNEPTDIPMNTGGTISYYCNANQGAAFCSSNRSDSDMLNILGTQSDHVSKYNMGPANTGGGYACGTLTFCDAGSTSVNAQCKDVNSQSCLACKAQQAALQGIVPILGQIAQNIVDADYNYAKFYELGGTPPAWVTAFCAAQNPAISTEQCCVKSPIPFVNTCSSSTFTSSYPDTGNNDLTNTSTGAAQSLYLPYAITPIIGSSNTNFIGAAVSQYITNVVGAVQSAISSQVANTAASAGAQWQVQAKQQGWILAGVYFYYMATANQNNLQSANQVFTMNSTDPQSDAGNSMSGYRNNYSAAGAMLSSIQSQSQAAPSFSMPPQLQQVSAQINDATSSGLVHTFISNLSGNSNPAGGSGNGTSSSTHATNPIASIATFGYQLMITAQLLFAIILVMVAVFTALATINPMVIGTGLTMSPLGEATKAIVGILTPFFAAMIVGIYSIGAILGIYVPLIPFMVFSMGAIGWLIGAIEAMVAAPIVALGILSPGGQHDILGRGEPAMMLLLNIFLRPSLMVFGLMTATLLAVAVINLINAGFLAVMQQIMSYPGLFEQILFISAYTSFIVTAMNKVFSLVYYLPERVLTWIGGPAVSYGEQEALGAAKQSVEGTAGTTGGAGKESAGAVAGGVSGIKQGMAREAEDKKEGAGVAMLSKKE